MATNPLSLATQLRTHSNSCFAGCILTISCVSSVDCAEYLNNNFNMRNKLLEIDREYAREMDLTDEQNEKNETGKPAR
jgi:hypothetical protein